MKRTVDLGYKARWIRASKAPRYLDMDKNKFNRIVRPYLTRIILGTHSVAYKIVELDRWAELYEQGNGTPAEKSLEKITCEQNTEHQQHPDSSGEMASGISTSESVDKDYAKALARVLKRKRA